VLDYDHHCPWLGTCIGRNNYAYFFGFIISLLVHLVLTLVSTVLVLVNHSRVGFLALMQTYPLSIPTCAACLLFLLFLTVLVAIHIFLLQDGQTTSEYCKNTWSTTSGNPFAKSNWCKNLWKRVVGLRPKL
jgi:hypothetical protein